MNRKILLIGLALAAVLMATPYVGMAHACTTSQPVNGVYFPTGVFSSLKITTVSAKLQIWDVVAPMAWSGGISGAGNYVGRWYVYNHDSPDMKIYGVGEWTLSATVDGKAGTLKIIGISVSTETTTNGCWTIICGTGGLAHLHGGGTYSEDLTIMPPLPAYPYTGQVHFDPKIGNQHSTRDFS